MKDRPLRSSEILLLELLRIAERRAWPEFARDLLIARAHQNVQVLENMHRAALRISLPEEREPGGIRYSLASRLEPLLPLVRREQTRVDEWALKLTARLPPFEAGDCFEPTKVLLDVFAEIVAGLEDDERERIDRHLETRHRRFVALGETPDVGSELDAEMRNEKDRPNKFATAGLALSGGGIRSASFAIGGLQSLSRAGILPAFDYVSSVSGGGYAASWMAAWAYRHAEGIHGVELELFRSRNSDCGPLRWVRRHSSYLAPRPGLSSIDAWALFVAYVTNWLPILALICVALTSLLLLPHALAAGVDALARSSHSWVGTLCASGTALALIVYMSGVRRLTLYRRKPGALPRHPLLVPPLIFWGALLVTVAISATVPLSLEFVRTHAGRLTDSWPFRADSQLEPAATIFLLWLATSWLTLLFARALGTQMAQSLWDRARIGMGLKVARPGPLIRQKTPIPLLLCSALVSSLVASLSVVALLPLARAGIESPSLLITFGPLTITSVFAGSEVFGLMLTLKYQQDVDRAWAALMGAWMLACVAAWTVLSGLSLGSTALWNQDAARFPEWNALVITGALLLFSALFVARRVGRLGLVYVAIGVLLLLPLTQGVARLTAPLEDGRIDGTTIGIELVFTAGLALLLAMLTNVNRYSLHSIYKEGLVRTFLGASRLGPRNPNVEAPTGIDHDQESQFMARRPDPSINIDDEDDPPLMWLKSRPGRELPVLLLNAAVNGSSPTDLEGRVPRQWPYTFSQYYSGSPAHGIGYADTAAFFSHDPGKGASLGTAMAVSGAAMSPTSGRTTHPVKAFILGFLNARLGIWIGNPHHPGAVASPKPPLTRFTLLREMLGLRAKFGPWIHLSDGGHFENLGVYELLRRGCHRIVVLDASCDPDRHFVDLANAIRRAQIDLSIRVTRRGSWEIFGPRGRPQGAAADGPVGDDRDRAPAATTPGASGAPGSLRARAWTWFDIEYGHDLPSGRLLYIKPSVYEDEVLPVEIRHYWREFPEFPHESTADQFFTERQLEAYRILGEKCVVDAMTVLDHVPRSGARDMTDADSELSRMVRRSLRATTGRPSAR